MRPEQDAFGRHLLDHLEGLKAQVEKGHRGNRRLVVERDDGFVEAEGVAPYFAEFRRWWPVERQALRYVRGRVLDVGVGAGRVAVELQSRGHDVVGIDVSPLTVRVARRRGVRKAKVLAFEHIDSSLGRFDTVVMFMNNFGLFGSEPKAKSMLRRLHRLTTESGRIVATNNDPYAASAADHVAYRGLNRRRGRMAGQVRLRLRYRRYRTPWFDYLFVSPGEMERLLKGTGWRVRRFIRRQGDSFYAAVIEKDA